MAGRAPQSPHSLSRPFLSRPMAALRIIGALALVAALLVIAVSVVGRHIGILLPGSVELAEVLFVVVAASSMVFATADKAHATARLILDRLPDRPRQIVVRVGLVAGATLWFAVTIGNLWMLHDVWSLHEVSPLLHIPIVPFRIIFAAATAAVTGILIWHLFKGRGES